MVKYLLSAICLFCSFTPLFGQIKDEFHVGISTIFSLSTLSGYFEYFPNNNPNPDNNQPPDLVDRRGDYDLNDYGYGIRVSLGYGKLIKKFYIGGETTIDYISSQNPEDSDNGWRFELDHSWSNDLALLFGYLIKPKYLLYGRGSFIPRSRFIVSGYYDPIGAGPWQDHNFIGFSYSLGTRINVGFIDLKIEIKNSQFRFRQPTKDLVASADDVSQWEFEFGVVKAFSIGKKNK